MLGQLDPKGDIFQLGSYLFRILVSLSDELSDRELEEFIESLYLKSEQRKKDPEQDIRIQVDDDKVEAYVGKLPVDDRVKEVLIKALTGEYKNAREVMEDLDSVCEALGIDNKPK